MARSKRMTFLLRDLKAFGPCKIAVAVAKLQSLNECLPDGIKRCSYDQTVQIDLRLGVDPKQADQLVRGSIVLPNGSGRACRVIVFCSGEAENVARDCGADAFGGRELADRIKSGWTDFDVALATPDMMGIVGPLGRILGPRGLMPSPKAGTVTLEIATAIREYRAGKIEFRVDSGANVHCVVGKMSFTSQQIVENADAVVRHIISLRPIAARGVYLRGATLSASASPGISLLY